MPVRLYRAPQPGSTGGNLLNARVQLSGLSDPASFHRLRCPFRPAERLILGADALIGRNPCYGTLASRPDGNLTSGAEPPVPHFEVLRPLVGASVSSVWLVRLQAASLHRYLCAHSSGPGWWNRWNNTAGTSTRTPPPETSPGTCSIRSVAVPSLAPGPLLNRRQSRSV